MVAFGYFSADSEIFNHLLSNFSNEEQVGDLLCFIATDLYFSSDYCISFHLRYHMKQESLEKRAIHVKQHCFCKKQAILFPHKN